MILTVKRQMIILQAYVPIAPVTQGRKGKILFCRKGRGRSLRADNKNPADPGFLDTPENRSGNCREGCRLSRIASEGECQKRLIINYILLILNNILI